MDFVVPESFTLSDGDADISLSYRTEGTFVATGRWIEGDVYRVIGYSLDNSAMTDAEGPLFTLSLDGTSTISAGAYVLDVDNVLFVTENAIEDEMVGASAWFEVTEEQATYISTTLGADPCWPADIYDVHGRLVRERATSFDGLGKGVYIVNNRKQVR
jgi:hypothetical protein